MTVTNIACAELNSEKVSLFSITEWALNALSAE